MIGDNQNLKQRPGFTLMEMLVSVTIFSLAMTAIAAIFVVSTQAQKRAGSLEKIDQQVKYLLEFFVNSVKQAEIDYSVLNNNPVILSANQYFNFLTTTYQYTSWRTIEVGTTHVLQQCKRMDRYCLTNDPAGDWSDLHSRDLDLPVVTLIVNPLLSPWQTNPDTGGYLSDQQPLITLVLSAKTVKAGSAPMTWQTTIASRLYKR